MDALQVGTAAQSSALSEQCSEEIRLFLEGEPLWKDLGSGRLVGPAKVVVAGRTFTFQMEIVIPADFPAGTERPRAYVRGSDVGISMNQDAHVDPGGSLCLGLPERTEDRLDSLRAFVVQVTIHLRRIVDLALTGSYPGPAYSHGDEGKAEYLLESLPPSVRYSARSGERLPERRSRCPCGSMLPFGRCHRAKVVEVRSAIEKLKKLNPSYRRSRPARNPFKR